MLSALPYLVWAPSAMPGARGIQNARRGVEPLSMLNTLRAFLLRSAVSNAVKAERSTSGRRFQPVAEMLLHPLDRGLGVALGQCLHHRSMLAQRILDPPRFEQGLMAVQFHDLAQIRHHLVAPAVAGD